MLVEQTGIGAFTRFARSGRHPPLPRKVGPPLRRTDINFGRGSLRSLEFSIRRNMEQTGIEPSLATLAPWSPPDVRGQLSPHTPLGSIPCGSTGEKECWWSRRGSNP